MIRYCAGFLFSRDRKEVALVLKNRGPEKIIGCLTGIGGKINPGESAYDAVEREFLEETSLRVPKENWRHFCTLYGDGFEIEFFKSFIGGEIKQTESELVSYYPVSIYKNDQSKLTDSARWLIPLALDPNNPIANIEINGK